MMILKNIILEFLNKFYKLIDKSNFKLLKYISHLTKIFIINLFYKKINNVETIKYIFNFNNGEGHAQKDQLSKLGLLAKDKKRILEIGFNYGHSAENFLINSEATLISLDIGIHEYCLYSEQFLKKKYPKRLNIIYGDSKITIKNLIDQKHKFDLIYIDGGHNYEDAYYDIENSKILSDENTIIVLDDVEKKISDQYEFNKGPTQAWEYFLKEQHVVEKEYIKFEPGRGIVIGNFI